MQAKWNRAVCWAFILCVFCGILALTGCAAPQQQADELQVTGLGCIHEPEFGGVYIEMTIDDFNALGFEYGDSVTVSFSNGYTLEDLPYYNGYYTVTGEPLLIAYPGYDYIKAAINNSDDLWQVAELDESCVATITLFERGKYLATQEARDLSYKDDRSAFPSDDAFANFRSVKASRLKEDILYRSASPCDNQHKRAGYTDALMAEAGVRFILDLADNEEKIKNYLNDPAFDSPCFLSLYENGKVLPLALNMNYGSEEFKSKVVKGLTSIAQNDGPYLIHCTEGKDRTGFVCMLIEALAGASYDEIETDYMITYENYYGITESLYKEKYDIIVESLLVPMIQVIVGDEDVDVTAADLSVYAEDYLRAAGMQESELSQLYAKLMKP